MQQVNIKAIHVLGRSIGELQGLKKGALATATLASVAQVRTMLYHLIGGQPIPLTRCIPFAKILDDQLERLQNLQDAPRIGLSDEDVLRVRYAVNAFEQSFAHEVDNFEIFYVPPKGTHATLKLIDQAALNLSEDVRSRLAPETIDDLRQAGRCLALDAPTAAGFHLFRAVETLIRGYHTKLTSKNVPIKNRNWGAYIRDLTSNSADSQVTGYLTHIKDHYRNPIMHPEVTLNSDEALSLFGAALSAITQLDAAIQK